jgi:hypothetical protein
LTNAFVIIYQIDTGTSVFTFVACTVVNIFFAVFPRVPRHASARVCIQEIVAKTSMLTRIRTAFINFSFASFTSVARRAMANKLVHTIFASTVNAWIGSTLINVTEATSVIVTSGTFAFETVDKVYTNTSVSAWI